MPDHKTTEELYQELVDEVGEEEAERLVMSEGVEILEDASSIWESGKEPLPFDEFAEALDGKPLFPRQKKVFEEAGLLRARDIIDPNRKTREMILLWGKGSIHKDTLIRNESNGEVETVAKWAESGEQILVKSWDGNDVVNVWTSAIFLEGCQGNLFRVTLDDGRQITVTAPHVFLTPTGWKALEDLSVGSQIQTLEYCGLIHYSTISEISQVEDGDFYDITVPGTNCYYGLNGILSHNSGKDYCAASYLAYIAYVLLNLKENPSTYLGLAPESTIYILNVATNEEQAKRVFFDGYLKPFIKSPVFRKWITKPKDQILSDTIFFPDKHLTLYSMCSKTSANEGYNVFAFVLDECDAFGVNAGVSVAEEIHKVFRSSAATRMRKIPHIGMIITYTRVEDGFAMQLYDRAKKQIALGNKQYYVDLASTWDVRPDFSRDDPTVKEDYERDPRGAAALYECVGENTLVVDECGLLPIKYAPNRIYKGSRNTVKLTTKYGYELIATKDHRVLTGSAENPEWSEIGSLSPGDRIIANQSDQVFGQGEMDLRLSEFIGTLIGDGHIAKAKEKNGIYSHAVCTVYDPKDSDVAERHFKFLTELGYSPKAGRASRCLTVRVRTKSAFDDFQAIIGDPVRAWDKKVPDFFFNANRKVVSAFLSGLFEADGSVNNQGIVSYGSTSLQLIKDIQVLLNMFGLTGAIHYHKSRWNPAWENQSKEFWTVQLSSARAEKFFTEIGFVSKRKRLNSVRRYQDRGYTLSSRKPLFVDKVVSIEDFGEQPVYDLLNRPDERFVANGLVVHNCKPMATEDVFFQYSEKILEAANFDLYPIADVDHVINQRIRPDGNISEFVGVNVTNIRQAPGRKYFIGVDGGEVGDSFAIAVFHTDVSGRAVEWICPKCGGFGDNTDRADQRAVRSAAVYVPLPPNASVCKSRLQFTGDQLRGDMLGYTSAYEKMWDKKTVSAPTCNCANGHHPDVHCFDAERINCGICGMDARSWRPMSGSIQGWWHNEDRLQKILMSNGNEERIIPRVVEDLLIEIKPTKATVQGQKDRTVDFVSAKQAIIDLINGLGGAQCRLDPALIASMIHELQETTHADVDKISFSLPEQYIRAQLVHRLLNAGGIALIPGDSEPYKKRDTEWRKLQLIGTRKIDHPPNGSKDLWDAESVAIWLAVNSACADIRMFI